MNEKQFGQLVCRKATDPLCSSVPPTKYGGALFTFFLSSRCDTKEPVTELTFGHPAAIVHEDDLGFLSVI